VLGGTIADGRHRRRKRDRSAYRNAMTPKSAEAIPASALADPGPRSRRGEFGRMVRTTPREPSVSVPGGPCAKKAWRARDLAGPSQERYGPGRRSGEPGRGWRVISVTVCPAVHERRCGSSRPWWPPQAGHIGMP
jgi:hypothetical protein